MAKQPSPRRQADRHLSFTTKGKDQQPVTFDINGTEFTCRAQVPGVVLLEHLNRLMNRRTAAEELVTIWQDVLPTERELDEHGDEVEGTSEHERFMAYLRDPSHEVDVQDLGEFLQGVLGKLTGRGGERPTPPPSRSQRGRSTTGDTSTYEHDEQVPDLED